MRTIWFERLICCHFILQNKWLDKHRRHRWVSGSGVELREECSQHNWQRFCKPVPCRGHAHGCLANTKLMNRNVSSQTVLLQAIRGCREGNVPVSMCLYCFVCLDADKWSIANYRGGVMLNRQSLWLWFISYKMKVFVETSKTLMTPTPYFLVNVILFRIICQDDTANVVAKGRGAHCENIWQSILTMNFRVVLSWWRAAVLGCDVILPRLKVHYGMLASLSPPVAETQNFQSRLI